jgi:hypothetical protein
VEAASMTPLALATLEVCAQYELAADERVTHP